MEFRIRFGIDDDGTWLHEGAAVPLTRGRGEPTNGQASPAAGDDRAGFARDGLVIRLLDGIDAAAFHALRLQGLREAPAAFASSWEDEQGEPLAAVAARLSAHDRGFVLGAFAGEMLVGVTGVQRESMRKLAHKAYVWGVYVAPTARRCGVARRLLSAALSLAATRLGVRQLLLGVNARNAPAIALYHELGFEDFGLEPDFLQVDGVYEDEIHMICRLLPAAP